MTKNLVLILIILLVIYTLIPDSNRKDKVIKKENDELRGIFVSYIELSNYIKGKR